MHMLGKPRTMQINPTYEDVVTEVRDYLGTVVETAMAAGIKKELIIVDPGIGFGKTLNHNLLLIKHIQSLWNWTSHPCGTVSKDVLSANWLPPRTL